MLPVPRFKALEKSSESIGRQVQLPSVPNIFGIPTANRSPAPPGEVAANIGIAVSPDLRVGLHRHEPGEQQRGGRGSGTCPSLLAMAHVPLRNPIRADGRCLTRTGDLLLVRQALYQLS
jgi:hypothetical protein